MKARVIGCVLGFVLGDVAGKSAEPPMIYRHNAPESPGDTRYVYHWTVLRAALDRTRAAAGDYRMETGAVMTEQRQIHELQQASAAITVMYLDATPELERTLRPIRIPVDKGLVGFRIFLLRRERLARLAAVRTLADLRPLRLGAGLGWADVPVLQSHGLRVVTGSSYEGLFDMLNNDRFDAFPRGAVEIVDEWETRRGRFPELVIEPELILHFPQPMYFWFARSEEGQRLARRAETGLREMIADGTFDRIFAEHQLPNIQALNLSRRRIIRLTNPHLSPETPLHDRRLWFDPATYVPPPP